MIYRPASLFRIPFALLAIVFTLACAAPLTAFGIEEALTPSEDDTVLTYEAEESSFTADDLRAEAPETTPAEAAEPQPAEATGTEPAGAAEPKPAEAAGTEPVEENETELEATDGAPTALDGIDISSWQAGIDLSKIAADFVIIKATGGTGYTNPYFEEHANTALESGKYVGLYHYACEPNCEGTAIEEADYFISALQNANMLDKVALALQWSSYAYDQGTGWAKDFLDHVHEATGIKPLIYMAKNTTRAYDWSDVAADYDLWMAQYADLEPTDYQEDPWTDSNGTGAWESPLMFQYACTGQIEGYDGDLNLNKFYGEEWPVAKQEDPDEPDDPDNENGTVGPEYASDRVTASPLPQTADNIGTTFTLCCMIAALTSICLCLIAARKRKESE